MKFNTPLPQPLPKECIKAAQIFSSFVDSHNNGLDGVIPHHVLENARGFAIYSVLKAGFLLSARAGSGVVIAKLPNGDWSAPSAIGTAGMGVGTQAGAELTDVLIVLNSQSAVRSFMSAGSVTLGTNLSVAVGPLGRNGEASGSINSRGKLSATYSYSKTRGLFGGVSLEGSVIVERQDANAIAYGTDVTASQLLSGIVDVPIWAASLVQVLEMRTSLPGGRKWFADAHDSSAGYIFSGIPSPSSELPPSLKHKRKASGSPFSPITWGRRKSSASYTASGEAEQAYSSASTPTKDSRNNYGFDTYFGSDFAHTPSQSPSTNLERPWTDSASIHGVPVPKSHMADMSATANLLSLDPSDEFATASPDWQSGSEYDRLPRYESKPSAAPHFQEGVGKAVALYGFQAREPGDLTFLKGDVIIITERTESSDDWWTGTVGGHKGLFPANFVELV